MEVAVPSGGIALTSGDPSGGLPSWRSRRLRRGSCPSCAADASPGAWPPWRSWRPRRGLGRGRRAQAPAGAQGSGASGGPGGGLEALRRSDRPRRTWRPCRPRSRGWSSCGGSGGGFAVRRRAGPWPRRGLRQRPDACPRPALAPAEAWRAPWLRASPGGGLWPGPVLAAAGACGPAPRYPRPGLGRRAPHRPRWGLRWPRQGLRQRPEAWARPVGRLTRRSEG
jgi:hypothetical protein